MGDTNACNAACASSQKSMGDADKHASETLRCSCSRSQSDARVRCSKSREQAVGLWLLLTLTKPSQAAAWQIQQPRCVRGPTPPPAQVWSRPPRTRRQLRCTPLDHNRHACDETSQERDTASLHEDFTYHPSHNYSVTIDTYSTKHVQRNKMLSQAATCHWWHARYTLS